MAILTKKQKKAVESIVVSYPAWKEHRENVINNNSNLNSLNSMKVWARILEKDQEALGMEIVSNHVLQANINGFLYVYFDQNDTIHHTNNQSIALES